MKNSWEGLGLGVEPKTRREEIEEKLKQDKEEKGKLDSPLGNLKTDGLFSNILHETLNSVLSIPNIPRSKFLQWKIERAKKKLQEMDEKDAVKVAKEYGSLVEEAAKSGDDTKMDAFEKKVGIDDGSLEEKE